MTLTEFVLARIAEDEAVARSREWPRRLADALWAASEPDEEDAPGTVNPLHDAGWDDAYDLARSVQQAAHSAGLDVDPARVLAECEAKRRIVEWCQTDEGGFHWSTVLEPLAAIYADHPDYRDDWRP